MLLAVTFTGGRLRNSPRLCLAPLPHEYAVVKLVAPPFEFFGEQILRVWKLLLQMLLQL